MTSSQREANRLAHETSPYLLQHAHNPVDWYPWGAAALNRARQEGRLILLSIGYSACHWCHVMERESFENDAIAAVMNEHYVNIKVDREERPDIDDIYMAATLAMNHGQGGWPMTVFLTPDLEPVFAGTYFPPDDRWGRPGFRSLLEQIARAWRQQRDRLVDNAQRLVDELRRQKEPQPALAVGEEALRLALSQYAAEFDPRWGGFGGAPKFPPATGLALLLRLYRRFGDPQALAMVRRTLDGMAQGGIYDHIGGGFARYSVDERWLVPHFEKMLYDNALLAPAYLEAFQVTGDPSYRRVACQILDYVLREMAAPEGGVYSSTDADSEGEEGKFFVWTPEQVGEVLDARQAALFCATYDVTADGNWEGNSIAHLPRPIAEVAADFALEPAALEEILGAARQKLYEARARRPAPALDDKILTAWNGLMINAFAEGHRVLGDERYLTAARRAADFVLSTLCRDDGRLLRTFRQGKAHLDAYLEDYAYLAEGLISLYETSGEERYLRRAAALAERLLSDFADREHGGFFHTAEDHEKLILRYREGADGATPAANAAAALALARLSFHLERDDLRQAAAAAVHAHGQMIGRYPRAFAKSLIVVDLLLEGPIELAFIGRPGSDDLEALRAAAAAHFLPNRIQALHDPDDGASELPLLAGKERVAGRAALYVCRDFACRAPVSAADDVAAALAEVRQGQRQRTSLAEPLAGRATAAGTARFAARFADQGFCRLGRDELTTSLLGFGGYRVDEHVNGHRQALAASLAAGVNLIDTSTNYGDGASERLVGRVLREAIDDGLVKRDEVVVVSKIGYAQGTNYAIAQEREAQGRPFSQMTKVEEGLWHSIHPEFLADQLDRSLGRLALATLDVCLLHNPEYFLVAAAGRGEAPNAARIELDRRLRAAFSYFESQVEAGRLGAYGVSSNTVMAPTNSPEATSLLAMLEAARKVAGDDHHFRVLQLPLNLLEPDAALAPRHDGRTVLEVARDEGIAVLVNRPLNALAEGRLRRLAEIEISGPAIDIEAQLARVGELEERFRDGIASQLAGADQGPSPQEFFLWAEQIAQLRPRINNFFQWKQIERQVAVGAERLATLVDRSLEGDLASRWRAWRQAYFPALEVLLDGIRRQLADAWQAESQAVVAAIDPLLPDARRSASLSQKALWTVASTAGVTTVLCGMRSPEYVADATAIRTWEPLADAAAVYRGLSSSATSAVGSSTQR